MMHTLSYPALGHILIWRKLLPLDGLLKSGQASARKAARRKQTGQLRLLTTGQRQCPLAAYSRTELSR